jgi:hypothetical protein
MRPIQLGHMCHGCNRIAWNHYWDQANTQTTVIGQAPNHDSHERKYFPKDRKGGRNVCERNLSSGAASAHVNGTGSQMPWGKGQEAQGYSAIQYLGYQVAGQSFEAVNLNRGIEENGITEGYAGMEWYLGPDKYQGASFDDTIVGASAVSAAGGAQNLRNYPTMQTYQPVFLRPDTNSHHQSHSLSVGQEQGGDRLRSVRYSQVEPIPQNYIGGRGANIFANESRHIIPQYTQRDRETSNGTMLDARMAVLYPHGATIGTTETPIQNPRVKPPVTVPNKQRFEASPKPTEGPTLNKLSGSLCQAAGGTDVREPNTEKGKKIYEADLKSPINTAQLDVVPMVVSSDMI